MSAPVVSIITVTKDRARFFPHLIHVIEKQDIGPDKIEWVIVDEGPLPVLPLVEHLPLAIKYHHQAAFPTLGAKRNFANGTASGRYIAYFDDDDYAFPQRLRASVDFLDVHPEFDAAGSSDMYIYDNDVKRAYVTGPFGKTHATSGTWCFRRTLLNRLSFDENAKSAEETSFTRGWKMRLGQIGRGNTIVAFEHGHNTMTKKHLLKSAPQLIPLEKVIGDPHSLAFYRDFRGGGAL
jgi:hypothetical protein